MPLPKLKVTKPDSWAALFSAEIRRKETAFPPDSLTIEQIMDLRKSAGVSCSRTQTQQFLSNEMKAGKVKILKGSALNGNKLQATARYVIVS